ncbi:DUF4012 domain-containing protein [Georgenia sp. MJ173]|uniref:DUF4012 domain-containing protein n=1 Tax=Georgenia sunbinii TaxID=3117728 RepID=UPI002F2682C9
MTDDFPAWLDGSDSTRGASGGGDPAAAESAGSRRQEAAGRRSRSTGRKTKKSRRSRNILTGLILAVILALLALVVVYALQARTAYTELRAAMPQVQDLRSQALAGNAETAVATVAELQEHTTAARDALGGPHWSVLAALPWVGPNVHAAREATVVVDDLASDVLPDLVSATQVVNPANLALVDGRIDLAPIIEVAPQVIAADAAVNAAIDRLDAIDTDGVIDELTGQLTDLAGQLSDVSSLTATASRAVQLLPPMLGADEPREYLLLVQNNAEPRSTGGLTGAFVLLGADDGAIEILDQRSAVEVGSFSEPAVELTDTEVALFGTQLGRYPGNVTATPHFPRSAQIITEMWRQGVGTEVDGVMSVDPIVLASLLGATGPVDLPLGGELTSDNAVQLLLNEVYLSIADPADQDDFFQAAAGLVFAELVAGEGSSAAMLAALVGSADDGRLMIWSAHEAEQGLLSGTVLSGELRGDLDGAPVVGVYVNDLSAAKIAYYQHMDVELTAQTCHPDGTQDLTMSVTLTSAAPEDAADLPVSLVGTGRVVDKGDMRSNLLVYAPTGGRITDVRAAEGDPGVLPQIHNDLVVAARRVALEPGESATTEVDITTGPGYTLPAILRTTPGPGGDNFSATAWTCVE